MAELTRKDLLKDTEFMETVLDYRADRYGSTYDNLGEALDDFMEDYRAMQTNTFSTLSFARYAEGIEDLDFKKRFADAYRKVDDELENKISGEAFLDYAKYAIIDPINFLGFGTVKAISFAAGRQALKNVVSGALNTKLKQTAATGLAVGVEGAVAEGLTEQQIQSAEKDLGTRTEYDLGNIAQAATIGGVVGGGLGSAASSLTRGIGGMDDGLLRQGIDKVTGGRFKGKSNRLADVEKRAAKSFEQGTDQGVLGTFDNVAEYMASNPSKFNAALPNDTLIGKYVKANEDVLLPLEKVRYDGMGRITDIDISTNKATVEFLPKTPKNSKAPVFGTMKKSIDFTELKGLTRKESNKFSNEYIRDFGKFFDKNEIAAGKEFLESMNIETTDATNKLFSKSLDPQVLKAVDKVILDIAKTNPSKFGPISDNRKRISEEVAEILDVLSEDELGSILPKILTDNGITMGEFKAVYAADISIAASKLAKRGVLKRSLDRLQRENEPLFEKLSKADPDSLSVNNKQILKQEKELYESLKRQKEGESALSRKRGAFIDTWRSFLITQPATTIRNIVGSVLRVPGESINSALDVFFVNTERAVLGLDPLPMKDIVRTNPLKLASNLYNADEQVLLAQIVSEVAPEVDQKIFKTFDDYISIPDRTGIGGNQGPEMGRTLNVLGKFSQYANILNRTQDRAIKSVGFMTELDRQIVKAVNLNKIDKSLGIRGIEDLISKDRLDLLSDEMVAKSLDFAYKLTYQQKRIGDQSVGIGGIINSAQQLAQNTPIIRLGIPFANFVLNSIVYTTNRIVPMALTKFVTRTAQKRGLKGQEKGIARQERLKEIEDTLADDAAIKNMPKEDVKNLRIEQKSIAADKGDLQKNIKDRQDSISELIEAGAFIYLAGALMENYGGATWKELKFEDKIVDIRPLYPIPVFTYQWEFIQRVMGDRLGLTREFLLEGVELLTGLNPDRSGPLGKFLGNLADIAELVSQEEIVTDEVLYKFGESFAEIFTGILKGFGTPFKGPGDVVTSLGPEETRLSKDRDLDPLISADTDFPILAEFGRGFVNRGYKDLWAGTVFESIYDALNPEDVVAKNDPLTGKKQKRSDFDITKQALGARIMNIQDVDQELKRLDIYAWKLAKYTSVPSYNALYKKYLGELTQEKIVPYMNTTRYLRYSDDEKRAKIQSLYTSSSPSDLSPEEQQALRQRGKINVSLRQMVTDRIKSEKPILHKLQNFYKTNSKSKIAAALAKQPGKPKLDYKNFESEDSERENYDLGVLLDVLNKDIKMAEKADKNTRLLNRRGGYVSQMDALGFAEGGNVGNKGGTVLGKIADLNHPMTEAEIEAGRRLKTSGSPLTRALGPGVNYALEAISSGNPLETTGQRRVGSFAQTQKMLKDEKTMRNQKSNDPEIGRELRNVAENKQNILSKDQQNPGTKQQVNHIKDVSEMGNNRTRINKFVDVKKTENKFNNNSIKEASKIKASQINIGTNKRTGTAEAGDTHKLIKEGQIVAVRINLNSSISSSKGKEPPVKKVLSVHDGTPDKTPIADKPYVTVKPTKGELVTFLVNQRARGNIATKDKAKYPMMAVRGGYSKKQLSLEDKKNDPIVEIGFNPMKQHLPVELSTNYAVIGSRGLVLTIEGRIYTRKSDLVYAGRDSSPVPDGVGSSGPRKVPSDTLFKYTFNKGGIMTRRL